MTFGPGTTSVIQNTEGVMLSNGSGREASIAYPIAHDNPSYNFDYGWGMLHWGRLRRQEGDKLGRE